MSHQLKKLRIASLLPSTTDICIALSLTDKIVGITHECDGFEPYNNNQSSSSSSSSPPSPTSTTTKRQRRPLTLTSSHIDPSKCTQSEIDTMVKSSIYKGISLYSLNEENLQRANPTIILTQTLCDVCAVSRGDVDVAACRLPKNNNSDDVVTVLSLEPTSLNGVTDTFVRVAEACGVKDDGISLRDSFWNDMMTIKGIVVDDDDSSAAVQTKSRRRRRRRPRLLLLEWIDPPFDGGHWIPDMIKIAGCDVVLGPSSKGLQAAAAGAKSRERTWEEVYESDPDCVVIGCCGFDLERNKVDAMAAKEKLKKLRAFREGRIYVADGNKYFARPGPSLKGGVQILARCAYDDGIDDDVVTSLEGMDDFPQRGWEKMSFFSEPEIVDMEDIVKDDNEDDDDDKPESDFVKCHDDACTSGSYTYIDPASGYQVFTELAHKKRGYCCGSGCRHCPYNHENVKDKANRIQQPAFLFEGRDDDDDNNDNKKAATATTITANLSTIPHDANIKILFFSGGKDSFLTIRALVRQHLQNKNPHDDDDDDKDFYLVLLTTFDATSRIIAHQETHIDVVIRQATHLGLPLVGVPVNRASSETYAERIRRALDLIRRRIPRIKKISLVFGDLHLDHIRRWRDDELSKFDDVSSELEYPLWKVPYDVLMEDLEASKIKVVVSASTKEGVTKGMEFSREFSERVVSELGMDGFGENGEFHSVAEVWGVTREVALGFE